jgi:galactokinase
LFFNSRFAHAGWLQHLVGLLRGLDPDLAKLAGRENFGVMTPLDLAKRAHQAEVTHFGAPGGTMDHVTCAFGGLLRIGPDPWSVQQLDSEHPVGVWVLAYSGEAKDTFLHLHRCKDARLAVYEKLGKNWDSPTDGYLSSDEAALLATTKVNRDTEQEAFKLWSSAATSTEPGKILGTLMKRHHAALRDGLQLSTPKLESLNRAGLESGAWGFKVVGSGGGGCGVAWCSEMKAKDVENAMKAAGAPMTWIVRNPSQGSTTLSKPFEGSGAAF